MLDHTGRFSTVGAALAAGLALASQHAAPAVAAHRVSDVGPAVQPVGTLPMRFEPNVGQFDERVEFVARGGGFTLFLTPGEAVLALRGRDAETEPSVVRTRLVGANVRSAGEGVDELPGVTSYFVGDDPSRWRAGIVSFAKVRYGEAYPGVDMVYYGSGRELEYDFVVAPGADPAAIRMHVTGAERVAVDEAGDLVLEVAGGELRQRAPIIYQEGPAGRERVAGGYAVHGDVVGFAVGSYDPTRPLVVDPVLAYSRTLAGTGADGADAIAVGADGSVYVAGYTISADFPTVSPWQAEHGGDNDVFVAKLGPTGSALTYSTFLGGSGNDGATGIALGADGSAYLTGWTTSQNFPTASPFQTTYGGGEYDGFVAKLSASGSALAYSTYLGGSGYDIGVGTAVGADGNAYVVGYTSSPNLPTTAPFQATYGGGTYDAFVAKLSAAGSALAYSTYLGGSGTDRGLAIALDAGGRAYVTGETSSTNFPTASPIQANNAGGAAFVTKLSATGSALAYSTYLGGSGSDSGWGIAVGADGSAYVTGITHSAAQFPVVAPFQATYGGFGDAFVIKINASGSALVYSTYLGGSTSDWAFAIAVGADGSAYVAGETISGNFPTAAPIDATNGGEGDAFVTRLSPSGSGLTFSTYVGGSLYESARAITLGADGSVYLAGGAGINLPEFDDAFVMKITPGTATTPGVYVPSSGAWFLRNANAAGPADLVFTYGGGGPAVPIAGDWNGDGADTPGLYFPSTGAFFLKNANAPGAADTVFTFGAGGAGFVPLSGDWDGDGDDTVGLYAPATGAFFLRNANAPGAANLVFTYGAPNAGLVPLTGDWDGDGDDTVGLYDPTSGAFFLKNTSAGGAADIVFTFGAGGAGFVPLAGDWDGDGRDSVGLYAPATGTFFLRNGNAPGAADLAFSYGPSGATPLAGDWDGS